MITKLLILILLFNTTFVFSQQYEEIEIVQIINNKKLIYNTKNNGMISNNGKYEIKRFHNENVIYYSIYKGFHWKKK